MKKEYIIQGSGFSFIVPDKKTVNWIRNQVDIIMSELPENKQTNLTHNALLYWFATEMKLQQLT